MSEKKISAEDKILAVRFYLEGKGSQKQIASLYGVSQASFQQWLRNFDSMGTDAFTMTGHKKYPKELKLHAIQDYLSGEGSQDDICRKYGIRSKAKLQCWIKRYNGHEELKSSGTGGSTFMTKGKNQRLKNELKSSSIVFHMSIIIPKLLKNIRFPISKHVTILSSMNPVVLNH